MTPKKTDAAPTAAEIRASIADMQTQLRELRNAERRAKRAEAKAAAEARAKADRMLADELLAVMREVTDDAADELLVPALRCIAALKMRDRPLMLWAADNVAPTDDQSDDQSAD